MQTNTNWEAEAMTSLKNRILTGIVTTVVGIAALLHVVFILFCNNHYHDGILWFIWSGVTISAISYQFVGKEWVMIFYSKERIALEAEHMQKIDQLKNIHQAQKDLATENAP